MNQSECPRCQNSAETLVPVDSGLKQRLAIASVKEELPAMICQNCYTELEGNVGKGSVLMAQERAKEENKKNMWKNRVQLLKKARVAMLSRSYSEAAITYEKYFKVLEIIFKIKQEEFTPEFFKEKGATKELTVLTNAYWDLLRIYDSNEKYRSKQVVAAKKLSIFAPYTPIIGSIVKKAKSFQRQARNPDVINQFLKQVHKERGKCFIATAAFSSPTSPEVLALTAWRDTILVQSHLGRTFIFCYYLISPHIAFILNKQPTLKPLVQKLLRKFIQTLNTNTSRST